MTHESLALCNFVCVVGEDIIYAAAMDINGLAEVLMTLPAGTQCMVYVPWNLAYGAQGTNKISPYSALVYDLEILEAE